MGWILVLLGAALAFGPVFLHMGITPDVVNYFNAGIIFLIVGMAMTTIKDT